MTELVRRVRPAVTCVVVSVVVALSGALLLHSPATAITWSAFASSFTPGVIAATVDLPAVYVGPTGTLWAYGIQHSTSGGTFLYRSQTGGLTWDVSSDLRATLRETVLAVWQSPSNSVVYLGTTAASGVGLWVSVDSGATFAPVAEVAAGLPNPVSSFQEVDGVVYAGANPGAPWGGLSLYRLSLTGAYLGGEVLFTGACPAAVTGLARVGHDLILALSPTASICVGGVYTRDFAGALQLLRVSTTAGLLAAQDGIIVETQVTANLAVAGVLTGTEATLGARSLTILGVALGAITAGPGPIFLAGVQVGSHGAADPGLWVSVDGIGWSRRDSTLVPEALSYGNGLFLAGTSSGARCSRDGVTWDTCNGRPKPLSASSVIYVYVTGLGTCTPDCSALGGSDARQAFAWLDPLLESQARNHGVRPIPMLFSYRYPSAEWSPLATADLLADSARSLSDQIAAVATAPSNVDAQIVIVGHSQGGVIALLAVPSLPAALRSRVAAVFPLDSPIQGALDARIPSLIGVAQHWCDPVCASRVSGNVSVGSQPTRDATSVAQSAAVPVYTVASTNDLIVPATSASVPGVPGLTFAGAAFGFDTWSPADTHGAVLRSLQTSAAINDVLFGGGVGATPPLMTGVDSVVAQPGQSAGATVVGHAPSAGALVATLRHSSSAPRWATLTVATYSANPMSVAPHGIPLGFQDLNLVGANAQDVVAASLYYPTSAAVATASSLSLLYFTGSSWAAVRSSGGATPLISPTANLDGTASGGRVAVTFDATSTPSVLELGGTVFAFAQSLPVPPVAPDPSEPALPPAPSATAPTPDTTIAPSSHQGTLVDNRPPSLRLLGTSVEPAQSFHARWFAQSEYPSVPVGALVEWFVGFRNTGAAGWTRGALGASAQLGTAGPLDTNEFAKFDPGSWVSSNRVAMQLSDQVLPGKVGWFKIQVRAPTSPGTYRINVRPVIDGTSWLEDEGVFFILTVIGG